MFGYSLTFSDSGSFFIGNFRKAFFMNVGNNPSPTFDKVPELVFALYQGMFAAFTPAIAIGSAAERIRTIPLLVFIFVWSTLVYDVIASWCWSNHGWFFSIGGLDFAGGTPVHISSGAASLAYCIVIGKRHGHGSEE